ncbi:MAG: O-antigen ligase family protein [Acidimicrobiales bacterium]
MAVTRFSQPPAPGRSSPASVEGRIVPVLAGVAVGSVFLGVEPEVGAAVVRPFDGLVLLTAVVLAARVVVLGRLPRVSLGWSFFFAAAYLSFRSLDALVQSPLSTAVVETIQGVELLFLFWLVSVATRTVDGFIRFFTGLASAVAGIVIWATIYHLSIGEYFRYKSLDEPKLAFGVLLSLIVVARFERLPLNRLLRSRTALATVTLLVLFSGERKMWVGVAVALLVLVARPSKSLAPKLVLLTITALVVGAVAVGPLFADRLPEDNYTARQLRSLSELPTVFAGDSERQSVSVSNESRTELTEIAVEVFRDNPVAGIGPDNFAPFIRGLGPERPRAGKSPHNEYLLAAAETGSIGLVLFGSLALSVAVNASPRRSAAKRGRVGSDFVVAFSALAVVVNLFLAGGVLNMVFLILPAAVARGRDQERVAAAGRRPTLALNS